MNFRIATMVLASLISFSADRATAQGAPSQLRGKSVTATWTETRLQRTDGRAEFVRRTFPQSLSVYVSTEGHMFAKRTVWGGGNRAPRTGSTSSVGENFTHGQASQMRGHSLIVTTRFVGGARIAKIDFDPTFSNCTANVVLGLDNGAQIARGHSPITGQSLEIKSATVSDASCSMRTGNVFGD
jgi:hypothetical protein